MSVSGPVRDCLRDRTRTGPDTDFLLTSLSPVHSLLIS
jgi:hypothetical protein